MASSFKIKLKLPPNPNAAAASDRLSSAPTEGASSVADGTSSAMGSEVGDGEFHACMHVLQRKGNANSCVHRRGR